MNRFIERLLAFWIGFGLSYCVMRWAFHAGHLAAALAYIETGVSTGLSYLRKAAPPTYVQANATGSSFSISGYPKARS